MIKTEIDCKNEFKSDKQDKEEFRMLFTQKWVEIINKKAQQETNI